jgi:hypothetical protein
MNDLFKQEKHGELPRPISEGGERIPEPGIIVIGRTFSHTIHRPGRRP